MKVDDTTPICSIHYCPSRNYFLGRYEIYFDPASGFDSKANALLLEYNQKKAQEACEPRSWTVLFVKALVEISSRGWS